MISLKNTIDDEFNHVLYGDQIFLTLTQLSEFCNNHYNALQKNVDSLRYYWIDDEDDEICIFTQEDYLAFLHAMDNARARVYVVGQQTTSSADSSVDLEEQLPLQQSKAVDIAPIRRVPIHNIICDVCDKYVIGHRYMCLTCDDYDLCMNCEENFHHLDHPMVRIPYPGFVKLWYSPVGELVLVLNLVAKDPRL